MGSAGQLDQLDAGIPAAPIGSAVVLDGLADPVLLRAPLAGLALEEGFADLAVELVDIHRVEPVLELVVLRGEPGERLIVEALLVLVAVAEGLGNEGADLGVDVKSMEQLGELSRYRLLASVLLGTLALVAGASVIDVAALVGLAGHRAAAMTAAHQPGEGELVPAPLGVAPAAAVQDVLDLVVKLLRDHRLVRALVDAARPGELSSVAPVPKDLVDSRGRKRPATLAEGEAGLASHAGDLLQGVLAGRVPLEDLADQRRPLGVRLDPVTAVLGDDVAVTKRGERRPHPLLGLLAEPLRDLLGQVVDVVLGHQDLDPVHELLGRLRAVGEHYVLLDQMDLQLQLVDRHPILEVAVEPVGLLDKDRPA